MVYDFHFKSWVFFERSSLTGLDSGADNADFITLWLYLAPLTVNHSGGHTVSSGW